MSENKTKIIIETDAGRSEQVLQSVKKGLQDVGSEIKKTGKAVEEETSLLDSSLAKTALSFAAFSAVMKSAFNFAKEAAQLADAKHNLLLTAGEMGISYEKLVKVVSKGSNGMVNDLALFQQTHKALKLGISNDIDDLGKLWEVSEALSGDFAMTTEQTFEQISKAISEGNGKSLISLGLLPASFKRASDAGSLFQKRGELLKDVLLQTSDRIELLSRNGDTAADKFDKFDASIVNVKFQMGDALTAVFIPTVDWLNRDLLPALKTQIEYWQEWLGIMDTAKSKYAAQGAAGSLATIYDREFELKSKSKALDIASTASSYGQKRQALSDAGIDLGWQDDSDKIIANEKNKIELELRSLATQKEKIKLAAEATREEEKAADAKRLSAAAALENDKRLETHQKSIKKTAELYISLDEAIKSTYNSNLNLPVALKNVQGGLESAEKSVISLFDALKSGNSEWFRGELVAMAASAAQVSNAFGEISDTSELFGKETFDAAKKAVENMQNGIQEYLNLTIPTQENSLWDAYGGNILSTFSQVGGNETNNAIKDIKEPLAKTIAEAVQSGFANADFSNLTLTLGNIFTSILSKSVAQSNPVIDAAGSINFSNLGVNLAASAVSSVLTRSGRFFGGKEEHGKETVQKASDLRSQMGATYVDSFVSEITSVFASQELKNAISDARKGYFGTSVGYSWNDSGDGIFSDRTRTYALTDNGASAALKKLTDAVGAAETASEDRESWINLLAARGYEFNALQEKVAAYQKASSYYGTETLSWTDGTKDISENLTKYTREVQTALAEMQRELGAATAERSTNAANSFSKYAPWLDSIYMSVAQQGGNVKATQISDGYYANVSDLSMGEYFGAFEKLQNDYSDREISPALLDIIKQSGKSAFELEKLRITGSDEYAEKYLENVKKQVEVYGEIRDQQEKIFNDAAKSYEEKSSALANYEAAENSYYSKKLEVIAAEEAAAEAVKAKELEAAARSRDRMASALNIYGEIAQSGTKIYVIRGGNGDVALEELIKQNSDNPEVVSALKGVQNRNQNDVLWGEK